MKRLIVFFAFSLLIQSSLFSQIETRDLQCILYQNIPDPFEETTTIRFYLGYDCFIRLYVTNEYSEFVTLLAEGDIGSGDNGIIFKVDNRPGSSGSFSNEYVCILETYVGGVKNCTKCIVMQQAK
ncbi:MAG: hypothetical protein IAE90_06525 [Ignavibacteria bacterium]|nr:hypothetical protein [Ignavibacteria bacterium]